MGKMVRQLEKLTEICHQTVIRPDWGCTRYDTHTQIRSVIIIDYKCHRGPNERAGEGDKGRVSRRRCVSSPKVRFYFILTILMSIYKLINSAYERHHHHSSIKSPQRRGRGTGLEKHLHLELLLFSSSSSSMYVVNVYLWINRLQVGHQHHRTTHGNASHNDGNPPIGVFLNLIQF